MTVGLASIGVGWWGRTLATAAQTAGAQIVSGFSRSEEPRDAFAADFGCKSAGSLDEVLADPAVDGVLVATAHQSHLPIMQAAAAAGKHIFIEKPFTLTVQDGLVAIRAAEEAGVVLQVGHQRRRQTANRRINAMIAAGELGDLQAIESQQSMPNGFTMPPQAWRWSADEAPLGSITSLGIHKIDTMRYHFGPIRRVSAFTRAGRDRSIDEVSVLNVEFESGALGTHITSFFVPMTSRVAVYGTGGAAVSEGDGRRLSFQGIDEPGPSQIDIEINDPVVDQLAEFAKAVRGELTPEVDGWAGLAVVAVLEAAVESAATGRAVDVNEPTA